MYFVITNSEDGIYIESIVEEVLKKRLNEDYYGDKGIEFKSATDLEEITYWDDDAMLIIKGELVIPKPKEKVIEYDF